MCLTIFVGCRFFITLIRSFDVIRYSVIWEYTCLEFSMLYSVNVFNIIYNMCLHAFISYYSMSIRCSNYTMMNCIIVHVSV